MSGATKHLVLPDTTSYIYVCGITPYDSTHIGHAATYVFFDVLHRVLLATQKPVKMIENVTDIDEPLFSKAKEIQKEWNVLAEQQMSKFRQDMTTLRVLPPYEFVSVSENLSSLISHIGELIDNGTAYFVDSDVYFAFQGGTVTEKEIQTFKERGGDPERIGKKHPLDAVLWRVTGEQPNFESPWGPGRPGWHIECVSIIQDYASQPLLIQGGGSDLIFPHHEMGASQVAIMTRKPFARTYVHAGMVGLDGEKMSKSKGNLIFVSKLIAAGVEPMAIRLALLSAAYGKDRMWTETVLDEAKARMHRLQSALSRNEVAPTQECVALIIASLADNLDTVRAIKAIDAWIEQTESGLTGGSSGELSRAIYTFLGIAI